MSNKIKALIKMTVQWLPYLKNDRLIDRTDMAHQLWTAQAREQLDELDTSITSQQHMPLLPDVSPSSPLDPASEDHGDHNNLIDLANALWIEQSREQLDQLRQDLSEQPEGDLARTVQSSEMTLAALTSS